MMHDHQADAHAHSAPSDTRRRPADGPVKSWSPPHVRRLEAGSAEFTGGATVDLEGTS